MPDEVGIYVLATNQESRAALLNALAPSDTNGVPSSDKRHSGLVLQTMRDSWIYCKASKKMAAGNQLLPWLSASAVVISAGTGVTIFANLQQSPSTWAKAAVGAVAVLTAIITALQAWVASRIKTLNDQAHKFHEFHRAMVDDLEKNKDLQEVDYAKRKEAELQQIVVGISEPSPRAWKNAQDRVDVEMRLLFPRFVPDATAPTKTD